MVRIALIVTLMVALSPIVTDAWFWGSKKGQEEAPGPIETVTFRVGQGKKHAHHRDGALYQFIKNELVTGLWDQRINVKWIGPEKGFTRPELYSYDARGRQVGKPVDVEHFSKDQIEKLLIGKGFNRRAPKEEL